MQRLDEPSQVLAFLSGPARPDDAEPGRDLLFADVDGEALKVIMPVDNLSAHPPEEQREQMLGGSLRALAQHHLFFGLALVVRRGGSPEPAGDDFAWQRAFEAACSSSRMTDYGVYVATPRGARRMKPISGS